MSCSRLLLYVFVVVSTTLRVGSFDESAASVSESIGGTTESSKIDDPANATIADSVTNTIAEGLLHECWSSPSFACVQSGLRRALETSLSADFDVTDSVHFVSNHQKYTWQANNNFTGDDADNSIPDDDRFDSFVDAVEGAEGGARGAKVRHWHVGGLADVLYNRGARYLMTHDLNVELPEFAFGGGRIRVQPKSLDDDGGVWVKINFDEPPAPPKAEGRIFLKRIIYRSIASVIYGGTRNQEPPHTAHPDFGPVPWVASYMGFVLYPQGQRLMIARGVLALGD
ncbi:unnamed protein product [Nesidiocoris tenuis]|uniref:Uncharacterized protein n=1 Tax=Nesidiocoris tenuis TaxID=355587 RepID=A0A6H5G8J3_9HEMI|nr:unnamed protein product [Nesidiocoris tenuis]